MANICAYACFTYSTYPFKMPFCALITKGWSSQIFYMCLLLLCRAQIKEELCFLFFSFETRWQFRLKHLVASNHVGWRGNLRLTRSDDWHAVSPLWELCDWPGGQGWLLKETKSGKKHIWSWFKESTPWLSWPSDSVTQPHQERGRAEGRAERKKE